MLSDNNLTIYSRLIDTVKKETQHDKQGNVCLITKWQIVTAAYTVSMSKLLKVWAQDFFLKQIDSNSQTNNKLTICYMADGANNNNACLGQFNEKCKHTRR